MTDEEITRAVAEKVMGWTAAVECGVNIWRDSDGRWARVIEPCEDLDFRPLTNDADACAVLDKMAADGNEPTLYASVITWQVGAVNCKGWDAVSVDYDPTMPGDSGRARRRAICEVALRAVGAWRES